MTDQSNDKISRRQTLAALIAAGMVPAVARPADAAGAPDFGAFNAAFAQKIVLPAFDHLVEITAAFAKTADAFAATPDAAGLEAVKKGFNDVADAWALTQQFRIGALAQEQRAERFAYWPERRNVVEKQINALLAGKGQDGLAPDQLANGSVAVQGLPVLERILYGEDKGQHLLAGDEAERRRAIVVAIARNLKSIAADAQGIWAANIKDPAKAANIFAANPGEGIAQAYTNLLTITQIVADQKLGAPLGGADAANAKPKAAEQWRSGRSLRNIQLNLETARNSVLAPGGFADLLPSDQAALQDSVTKAFDDAIAATKAAGSDLSAAVTHQDHRKPVTALLVKVNHLRDLLRQQMPPALGVTLGFNELDGDGS
ncbi:imelysin family protein [Dongia rigui]|uniref:Imelysin family protein n=1 Tax=Dongia rigui TaxID=940149 RepID=A0ABU5E459_9PROT|nr:imelysin family protein [Dongia rigui]MDY0874376.1 imelysin family protein [Dongia rigui]